MYNETQIYFSISDGHGGDIWRLAFLNGTSIDPCSDLRRGLSNMPSIQILSLSATNSQKLVSGKMSELTGQSGGHSGQCGHPSVSRVVTAASHPHCLHFFPLLSVNFERSWLLSFPVLSRIYFPGISLVNRVTYACWSIS